MLATTTTTVSLHARTLIKGRVLGVLRPAYCTHSDSRNHALLITLHADKHSVFVSCYHAGLIPSDRTIVGAFLLLRATRTWGENPFTLAKYGNTLRVDLVSL